MTDRVVKKCGIGKNPGSGWGLFFNGIKYLPVILERSEESGQRLQVLNTFLQLSYAGFFATHNNQFLIFHFFMYAYHRSRMTAREDCVFQWYYILARHLFYAGFFAKSQIMSFDISFLYACLPPLKNDVRGVAFKYLSVILERT